MACVFLVSTCTTNVIRVALSTSLGNSWTAGPQHLHLSRPERRAAGHLAHHRLAGGGKYAFTFTEYISSLQLDFVRPEVHLQSSVLVWLRSALLAMLC